MDFYTIPAALLLITSKLSIFIVPGRFKNFFIQSLSLYTSSWFSMFFINDVVDIEKSDGICLPIFAKDEFSGLFVHSSIFSIKHSRSA